jgi:hypothetical protein
LTGNSLLLTFNIRQDEEIVRIRTTGKTSGTGRMLKILLRLAKTSMIRTCITTGAYSRRMLKRLSSKAAAEESTGGVASGLR